jgi:hypothetical protein
VSFLSRRDFFIQRTKNIEKGSDMSFTNKMIRGFFIIGIIARDATVSGYSYEGNPPIIALSIT